MNQQPDKIFRDKLQHYQPTVSPAAWSRVSGNLSRRSDIKLWMKVAAGLLLLAIAGIGLITNDRDVPQLVVSETPDISREPAVEENIRSEQQEPENSGSPEVESKTTLSPVAKPRTQDKRKLKKDAKHFVPSPATERTQAEESTLATTGAPLDDDVKKEYSAPEAPTDPAPVATTAENESITIVFTSADVEKYLMKKTTEAEATSEEKEASTWQKLLDKAHDLKHNQDPLGNLRQKKNEILALNFKNDKQRHENK